MMTNKLITTEAIPGSVISKKSSDVQIGFEFEICIPKESVVVPPPQIPYDSTNLSWLSGKTINMMYEKFDRFGGYGFSDIAVVGDFSDAIDKLFRLKRKTVKQRLGISSPSDLKTLWFRHQSEQRQKYRDMPPDQKAVLFWNKMLDTIKNVREIQRSPLTSSERRTEAAWSIKNFYESCRELNVDIPKIVRSRSTPTLDYDTISDIMNIARRLYINTNPPVDRQWNHLRYATDSEYLYPTEVASRNSLNQYQKWITDTFGTTDIRVLLNTAWGLRTNSAKRDRIVKILWAYTTPDVNPTEVLSTRSSEGTYSKKMRTWLKSKLEPLFGTIEVFSSYHEQSKKLDRWYIEPDGSLRPNADDYAAEVVGPPMPVKQAIDTLKTFVAFCKENGIYTNNSTGLHINVSIPGNIDPLKLVVFSGDSYALKKFGRENSTYARSIMNSLKNNSDLKRTIGQFTRSESQKQIPNTILLIASNLARDHFSSVNITPSGYVSFRHAGGNYLDDLEGILIVLRNFVRSMVLASNPELGKQEYLTKLSGFIPPQQSDTVDIRTIKEILYKKGIPLIAQQIAIFNSADNTRDNIDAAYKNVIRDYDFMLYNTETGNEWRDDFISGGGLRLSTIDMIRNLPSNNFHTLYYLPSNIHQVRNAIDEVIREPYGIYTPGIYTPNGDDRIGVARLVSKILPPGSPEWRKILPYLIKILLRSGTSPNIP